MPISFVAIGGGAMGCDVSGEQLWSWIDRGAPELEEHLAGCPSCREKAARMREDIELFGVDGELPLPDKIGPYTVRRLVGEGGQALVYEAEQPSPRRAVALKVLKGGHLVDKNRLRHFRREIDSLARLTHPHIAAIYEAGRTPEGLHYFAMELVGGVALHTYVKEKNPARSERLRTFRKVCQAVHYAHGRGVVHRDLKPSNILVGPDGEPKILDFGLARLTRTEGTASLTMTREGHIEGTPRYMSPEQLRGQQEQIDHRSDIYALGVILYELLTGVPPRAITTISSAAIEAVCDEIPRLPSRVDSSLRGDFDAIVMKALEKRREDRYQSAEELAEDISRHLEGERVEAKRPRALYYVRRKTIRRAAAAIAGLAMLSTIAGLAYVSWRDRTPPPDVLDDRMTLLETHCRLLAEGSTEFLFQQSEAAPRRYPTLVEATLVSAQAHHLRRLHSEAAAMLGRATARDPSDWACRYLLEEIEAKQKPSAGGASASKAWTEKLAESADAWYMRSFAALNVDSALAWARNALERDPRHLLALAAVVHLSEIKGDSESVLAATDALIREGFNASRWLQHRILLLTRVGRFEESIGECDRMIRMAPDYYGGYYYRAKVSRRIGRYADAERDLSVAIGKIEGSGSTPYEQGWLSYHRGSVRWLLGQEEEAARDYEMAYRRLGFPTFANARLYIVLRDMGRTAEADEALAEARKANVDDAWLGRIMDSLAGSLTPDGLAADAESTGKKTTICEGYYYAGEAARLAGRNEEARRWFERCVGTGVEFDPSNVVESQSEFQLARMRLSELADSGVATAGK